MMREILELDIRIHDFHHRKRDSQLDHHVMNRQRLVITLHIQTCGLVIAHRSPQQNLGVIDLERPHFIVASMNRRVLRISGQDGIGIRCGL